MALMQPENIGILAVFITISCFIFRVVYCNCDSEIYCRGPILEKIQMSGLFADSKQFVDMPTSKSKAVVLRNFAALPENVTNSQLRKFVSENFHRPGFEMRIIIPKDWRADPAFLKKLNQADGKLKVFAEAIHSKWKGLTRRFDQRKLCGECQASSLKLPYPFIVPGGRFREFYYWDSYWILEGLYVSEMCTTATGLIENMLVMIEEIGFIPNGARIYYMNRSQPPLFPLMIKRFMEECIKTDEEKRDFLKRILPLLEKEYSFWMKERSAELLIENHGNVTLNVYRVEHWIPRPESFLEDKATASLPKFDSELKKQILYQNIASAAESGWDFSGRWIKGNISAGLEDIHTVMLVPTDLNVFMLRNEELIIQFLKMIEDSADKIKFYEEKIKLRQEAMNLVLFPQKQDANSMKDFDLGTMEPANRTFYISDLANFWFMNLETRVIQEILTNYKDILFKYPGGIPASEEFTGQQWDFPNVWAPIQQLFIDALLRFDNGTFGEFYENALNISQRFINSVYCGYEMFGQIFEKYHAINVGYPGGGGEYIVQEGFGWTNGVILWIMDKFGNNLTAPTQCLQISTNVFAAKKKTENQDEHEQEAPEAGSFNRIIVLGLSIMVKIALLLKMY